jgi:hypothetical protein
MKKHVILLFIFMLILSITVNTSYSQENLRVMSEFRKLEQYVQRVADLVHNFQDEQAQQFIIRAFDNLENARRLLFEETPPRITLARFYMLGAKKNTDQAAKIILRKPLTYLKSQLDEKIDQAERAISVTESDEAHYLLNQAKKYRRWSYTSFLGGNLGKGQEFFRISYFFAQKCLEFLSGSGKDINLQIENLEADIRQLLVETEELVQNSDNQQLQDFIADAIAYFEEALQLAENGKLQIALKRMQLVKRLLYRIFDLADREDDNIKSRLENNLYSLRSFLQSLAADTKDSPTPEIKNMLEKAWEFYNQAEQSFNQGEYAQVKPKIMICQRLANRILEMLRRTDRGTISELERRTEETRQLLSRIGEHVDFSDKPYLQSIYEEANRLLDLAYQAMERSHPQRAFQYIQTATRLAARLQRETKLQQQEYRVSELQRTYQRITNMIQRLKNSDNIPSEINGVLDQLTEFTEKGHEYLDQENLVLADEYFNSVYEQLKQLTSRWQKN